MILTGSLYFDCFVLKCPRLSFYDPEYNQTRLACEKLVRLFALVHVLNKSYIPTFILEPLFHREYTFKVRNNRKLRDGKTYSC